MALVRPVLEYTCRARDCMPLRISAKSRLCSEGRRAGWSTVVNRPWPSVGEMYNQLKWSPLDERRRRARLITFFKFRRGEVVINTTNTMKPVPNPPSRSTRRTHAEACLLPACRTQYRQKPFFPRTLVKWNCSAHAHPQNRMKVDDQRKKKKKYRSVHLTVVSCEPHLETTQRSIGTKEALKCNKTGPASCTCIMNIITFESISSFRIVDSFWVDRVVPLV